ncbi:hypothetical protein O3P69_010925 [Scylla paramamosain]|uniref:Uncharacterized protein n=1 Tax=Scylla paramamosain TaxID=85552 RepID=A0AAW0SD87_SCYPA
MTLSLHLACHLSPPPPRQPFYSGKAHDKNSKEMKYQETSQRRLTDDPSKPTAVLLLSFLNRSSSSRLGRELSRETDEEEEARLGVSWLAWEARRGVSWLGWGARRGVSWLGLDARRGVSWLGLGVPARLRPRSAMAGHEPMKMKPSKTAANTPRLPPRTTQVAGGERVSEGYGRQYGDPYGGGRSSQEYSCDRSNSWEVVTGEGADDEAVEGGDGARDWQGGRPGAAGTAAARTSWHMDNLESEVALNILNAVLTNKEEAQWSRQRDWEGRQKRRMDWDDQYYGSGCGILPTPQMPPR